MMLPDDEPDSPADAPGDSPAETSPDGSRAIPDESEREDLISLRLMLKNLEDLASYRGHLLNEAGKREQPLMEHSSASQKNLETVTLALNPGPAKKSSRRWWPWQWNTL